MGQGRGLLNGGVLVAVVLLSALAHANTDQLILYNNRYPTTAGQANAGSNCSVCHLGAPALNPYGQAFKNSAAGPDSTNGLAQIEFVDSDGDNFTNLHEILKFNLPGIVGNFPANANTAPVLNAIGNKTLNEGQTLTFQVTTTDDVAGLSPLLSVTNLPPGATFTDNRDRTGTFTWVTDFTDGGNYTGIQFTSNDGLLTDTETISITVSDINEAPEMGFLEQQLGYAGSLIEFEVSATDPENAAVTLSATGLPGGASFIDNGDGTGTFSWTPGEGDIGVYPTVTFTAEDDATQTDSATTVIYVTAPPKLIFSDESPVLNSNSFEDTVLDYSADLATDGEGNWVAVWLISDTEIIMSSRSSDNGLTWSLPTPVSPLDGSDEAPQIATDGNGNWVVVWRSANNLGGTIGDDLDILYARSTDNGESWSEALPLNPDAAIDGSVSDRGANIATDGTDWIATWMSGTDVYAIRSTDAGLSWGAADFLGTGLVESFPDPIAPSLAGDGTGNWIVVWAKGNPFSGAGTDVDVQQARSADGGQTWTPQAALNPNAGSDSGDDQMASIATDGNGVWLAVWRSSDSLGGTIGTDTDILMSRSTNNGATWSAPAAVGMDAPYDTFKWDYAPSIATDGRGVWVSMWHSDGALIRMCYSTDDGAGWSFPEVQNLLHDDTTRLPQAVPDGQGSWLAVWETNENPLDSGFDFDVMLATAYAPNVQSISRDGTALTNADSVTYTVTFDRDVFGVDTGDFGVSTSKILSGASVAGVSQQTQSSYTVSVSTGSGTGTLALEFVDDDTVFADSGNVAGGPGEGNGDATGADAYTVDKTRPVITLTGNAVVNLNVGGSYTDAGATASDDLDGVITDSIQATGTVNTLSAGTYTIFYNVSDAAGNAANQVSRTVNVNEVAEGEGVVEGEGAIDGEGTPEGEGVVEGEGSIDGEGVAEGEGSTDGEGTTEGEGEGGEPSVYEELLYGFATAESSGDNLLTLAEIQTLLPAFTPLQLDAADSNGDDRLSVAELLAMVGGGILMSADLDGDFSLNLSEVIRVIQLYNAGQYACATSAGATEDGYLPRARTGSDPQCLLHSIDQNDDQIITLSELLRAIQFYSLGGYSWCPGQNLEDGFCG